MKLEIENIPFTYSCLESGSRLGEDPNEAWKTNGNEHLERAKKHVGIKYNFANLPYPFRGIGLVLKRSDRVFSAHFPIIAKDKEVFTGLSDVLEEEFDDEDVEWYSTGRDGEGYLLDSDGSVSVSIMAADEEGEVRDIGIGRNGAYPRNFGDVESFGAEIQKLSRISARFLNTCYSHYTAGGREFTQVPDNLTVYLTV